MEFLEALQNRRSVRSFTQEPVDQNTLLHLIDAANQAPSAVNAQPLSFTVVRDQDLLERISAQAKTHMLTDGTSGIPPSQLRDRLTNPAFHIFYHAPALVLISAVDAGPWAVEDCALAAENLMLTACAMGLGTCWIGLAKGWLQTEDGKRMIGLSRAHTPVAPIIVGHPLGTPSPIAHHWPDVRWIN